MPVPRVRIYGLVFAAVEPETAGTIVLRLFDGSEIIARRLVMDGEFLKVESSWKQPLTIPFSIVHSIDFSSGPRGHVNA